MKAKDASIQNEDTFDIYDPRNPLTKRRREESKREEGRGKRRREMEGPRQGREEGREKKQRREH